MVGMYELKKNTWVTNSTKPLKGYFNIVKNQNGKKVIIDKAGKSVYTVNIT